MGKEIIYSFKEYQEKYSSSLEKYFLQYKEIEEIDFIITEIEKYNICLQIINFPIQVAFNKFFRIEYGSNLKTFSIPQEIFDFIFANQNADYYYKIYSDLIGSIIQSPLTMEDCERKIKQTRLIFPKIISFLETKKSEHWKKPEPESFLEIDLSESSGVKKIIYLNELGIIDFLRTKAKAGISNDGLASVLSGITGLKPGTIKSSLNRLSNKDIADHRHPYSTKKTVDKIKKDLNDLGF